MNLSAAECPESKESVHRDVCDAVCVNTERVRRLKPEVHVTRGVAALFKALADDTRAKIVYALVREELCVCDVAGLVGTSIATASHHLRVLRQTGLVRYRREGKFVYYALDDEHVVEILRNALDHVREERL